MINYFDNAATTKVDDSVLREMIPYFTKLYGNPSSNNECGRKIKEAIENSRFEICSFLNRVPNEVIFTSGATESNNLAIKSCSELCGNDKYHFIFSEIEHKSVLNLKEKLEDCGHSVSLATTLPSGIIDVNSIEELIQDNTILISCIYVNNETGIIQPIEEISEICKENDIIFHTDATQAFGKLKIDLNSTPIDLMSFSGHKFHGPKGIGGLYKNHDIELKCQMIGGSQENGYRSGTENVPGIIGIGKATEIASKYLYDTYQYLENLEKFFMKKLTCYGFEYIINGELDYKVPWIFNIAFLQCESSADLIEKMHDFCFSKSTACSKGNYPSHVLQAMNVDEDLIEKSVRISFSKYTTIEQIDAFCERLSEII